MIKQTLCSDCTLEMSFKLINNKGTKATACALTNSKNNNSNVINYKSNENKKNYNKLYFVGLTHYISMCVK